jgi:hypothetical protein
VFEVSLVKVLSCLLFVSAEKGGWLLSKEKKEEEKRQTLPHALANEP